MVQNRGFASPGVQNMMGKRMSNSRNRISAPEAYNKIVSKSKKINGMESWIKTKKRGFHASPKWPKSCQNRGGPRRGQEREGEGEGQERSGDTIHKRSLAHVQSVDRKNGCQRPSHAVVQLRDRAMNHAEQE